MFLRIINKIFISGTLVLMILTLAGCQSKIQTKNSQPPSAKPDLAAKNAELEAEYRQSLKAILAPFWQNKQIIGIREQILDLRAPALYLDLHINLVLALDLVEQGQASFDQAKIEDGLDKINRLKDQYSWIQ